MFKAEGTRVEKGYCEHQERFLESKFGTKEEKVGLMFSFGDGRFLCHLFESTNDDIDTGKLQRDLTTSSTRRLLVSVLNEMPPQIPIPVRETRFMNMHAFQSLR